MKIADANPFRPSTPRTRLEWQAGVDCAQLLILLDLGKRWGLVDDNGKVNADRCKLFLDRGQELAISPRIPRKDR